MTPAETARIIKNKAAAVGFDFCGIARAGFLEEEAPRLEQWLKSDLHGKMGYMANHFDKRLDPTVLVPGAKSVISLLLNYYPEKELFTETDDLIISKYAYGKDYHFVIKEKLKLLLESLREEIGDIDGRVFVDSAPVMDKAWAKKSGLGWIGKNTNVIRQGTGSFFFIAELICDLEAEPDPPAADRCGSCTRCMDACPTDALFEPYKIDGTRCISYLTIELKDAVPEEFAGQFENRIFGCDICQDVCPWNRFARPHSEPDFAPHEKMGDIKKKDWEELTEEVFREIFRKSAVKRTKYAGLKRNIHFVTGPPSDEN